MSFNDDINEFRKKTALKLDKTFRGTVLSLFSKVILRTPVGNADLWDTKYKPKNYIGGRLRGNWQAQINGIPSGVVDTEDSKGGKTISSANAIVGRAKAGDSIFLINNLPYAEVIENGRSTQAPSGMVKVTVAEFQQVLNAQATKNK